jgi:hypothetical protein
MWCTAIGCIVTLLLSLLTAPLAAEAQPLAKIPRIGVLSAGPPGGSDPAAIEAFRQGLRDLGYAERRTIVIEYRWAEGREERLPPREFASPIQAKRHGGVRLLTCRLPVKSPWLNPLEARWVHGNRAVVEPARLLTTPELISRVCTYFATEPLEPLKQHVA